MKTVPKVFKNHPEGPLADKCNICWNANLKELKKIQGPSLTHSLLGKARSAHLIQGVQW
jgi:hypothetical protein